jgi:hypothetical protein
LDEAIATLHQQARTDLAPEITLESCVVRDAGSVARAVFAVDVLACGRCGGRLRLIATLEVSATTQRILRHLGLPTEVPPPTVARAPPGSNVPLIVGSITFAIGLIVAGAAFTARETFRVRLEDLGNAQAAPEDQSTSRDVSVVQFREGALRALERACQDFARKPPAAQTSAPKGAKR